MNGVCVRLSIALLASVSFLTSATAAWAQENSAQPTEPASQNDGDEIIVTGIRSSAKAALAAKRENPQFIDAIVAADIGKLPDATIAESLQRVSGVQIRRALGEGTSVSIRGIQQNRIEVNGRTLANPNGRGRGFDALLDSDYNPLALFPSAMISRLEVIKLLSADQADGSLGGTVNIVTRRPLDKRGQQIALSASGVYSELADRLGYDASALWSNTYASDRFGVLVNVTYSRKPVIDQSFNSFAGYGLLTTAFNTPANPTANDPNGDGLPGTFIADLRYQNLAETRERIGANLALQYQPSDNTEIFFDTVYSRLTTDRRRDWLSLPLSSTAADYSAYTLSANEVLVAGTINRPLQTNDERLTVHSDTVSMAFGTNTQLGRLTIRPELNFNYAQLENTQTYVRLQTISNYFSSFDFQDRAFPTLTPPTGLNLLDPTIWRFANIFDNLFRVTTKEMAGSLRFSYDLGDGFLRRLEFGGKLTDLRHKRDGYLNQIAITTPITALSPSLFGQVAFPDLLEGQAPFAQTYLAANPFGTGEQFACVALGVVGCTPRKFNPVQSFRIDEKTQAAFAKLNFERGRFSGNVGLRFSQTDRIARGTQQLGAVFTPIVTKPTYRDWLPSVSLKYEVTDQLQLRLGAGKVVGLPDIADLSPGIVLAAAPPLQGSAGNPNLDPFRAKQLDAAVEWYYAEGAALTLGMFYKDVDSFVIRKSAIEFPVGPGTPYTILRSYNGAGGKIQGVEVFFQQPFTFLPSPFDGFGVIANFSYIDSQTPFTNTRTGDKLPLLGLSKINYNLIGYFERSGFGARVAYNYRDRFLDSIASTGEGVFFTPYRTLDASVRYEFGPFTIFADATNLTNSAQSRYTGAPEATSLYAVQGRRYSAGVSAKF
jgi:iron complex outermembrane receptor protein